MGEEPPKDTSESAKVPGGKARRRRRRQAEALRRNLKKRKEQARARQSADENPGSGTLDGA